MFKNTNDPSFNEYSLRDFLTIVFKRKKIILTFFASLVTVVAIGSILTKNTYESRATILVKKGRAEIPLTPTESSELIINEVTEEELNSEIEILKSRRFIGEVVNSLDISEEEPKNALSKFIGFMGGLTGDGELSFEDEMVLHLERSLDIRAMGKSNIIEVTFRSKDRDFATKVVNTLTARYLEWRTEVFQSPQVASFFEEQMKSAGKRLSAAEEALEHYLEGASLTMLKGPAGSDSLAAQKSLVLGKLGELQSEFAEAEVRVRESEETVNALRARLAAEPERLASSDRFKLDPAVEEIERGLVTLELQRDALVQDYHRDSRQVRDIEEQIRLARQRLKQAQERVGSIDRTEVNEVHQSLKGELLRAEAELEGFRARYTSLRRQVAADRQNLNELSQKGFELERLTREAGAAEEAFLLYQKKFEEARMSAGMDQQKLVNVSIAQPAERPLSPVAPKTTLNLLAAIFLGLVGGLALAVVTEYLDHSFTTGLEVERQLRVPLLASIPEHR